MHIEGVIMNKNNNNQAMHSSKDFIKCSSHPI